MNDPRYTNAGHVSWIVGLWFILKYPVVWMCILCQDKCPVFERIKDKI